MNLTDPRGLPVSGATASALQTCERALSTLLTWRNGADELLDQALVEAPGFVMAHLLKAYPLACSRDPRHVRTARSVLAAATRLRANERERLHLAALARILADDHEGAADMIDSALRTAPRDVLALSVACSLDYLGGRSDRMRERVEAVLPAWHRGMPAYPGVQAMHAFALAECGEGMQAEDVALAALSHDPGDARAHHAIAHAFEMTDRPGVGARWMQDHLQRWGTGTVAATHCAWHQALFQMALGRDDVALDLYDRRIRAGGLREMPDLIDAAALLWRLKLRGTDAGPRWAELATNWAPHVDDGYCSFSDVHAMLAFVGAGDWTRAQRLEQTLLRSRQQPTRHGRTTRQLGLSACRGLMAFGRGDLPLAITLLASLPSQAHRLGGSHAQRDVLHLTLLSAVEAMRRPRAQRGLRGLRGALEASPPVHATLETRQPAARNAAAMPAA